VSLFLFLSSRSQVEDGPGSFPPPPGPQGDRGFSFPDRARPVAVRTLFPKLSSFDERGRTSFPQQETFFPLARSHVRLSHYSHFFFFSGPSLSFSYQARNQATATAFFFSVRCRQGRRRCAFLFFNGPQVNANGPSSSVLSFLPVFQRSFLPALTATRPQRPFFISPG